MRSGSGCADNDCACRKAVDNQTADRTAGCIHKQCSHCRLTTVQLDDRSSRKAWLCRAINHDRIRDVRKAEQGLDFERWSTDIEVDRIGAGIGIRVEDRLPQRAWSTVVDVSYDERRGGRRRVRAIVSVDEIECRTNAEQE